MSSHVWRIIYQTIVRMNRTLPHRTRKCQYNDTLIVAMYIWSVLHDRPLCWAADRTKYHGAFRPRRLPSRSQFCRRIQSPRCAALLRAVQREAANVSEDPGLFFMDGRALPVGPYTQDRDAGKGVVSGRFAKGYKLHAMTNFEGKIAAWRITPLNVSEKVVAFELVDEARPRGMVLADGNYDVGKLYDHTLVNGAMLFTPLPKNAGAGHRPQSAPRLLAARMWANGGAALYKLRTTIERQFSQQSSFGGGLGPLQAWVRTLPRVTRWVGTKLLIYHVRLSLERAAA